MCFFVRGNGNNGKFKLSNPKNETGRLILERFGDSFEYIPEKKKCTVRVRSLKTKEEFDIDLNNFKTYTTL